jgi:dUTP pyrophosphatase
MAGYTIPPSEKHDVLVYKVHPDAVIPERKSKYAAGYDLCTIIDFTLYPGQRIIIPTGLVIQPPCGYHTEILPRSGLAYKHGIMLTNNVGLIDFDFAGPEDEIKIMLYRVPSLPDEESYEVSFKKRDRIAQLVFRQTNFLNFKEIAQAPSQTDRGGFGSTGV